MKLKNVVISCILLSLGTGLTLAQRPPVTPPDPRNPLPDFVYKNEQKRRELERDLKRGDTDIEESASELAANREAARRNKINAEEQKRIERILAPNPDDTVRFSGFLETPKTGLLRLLPDFGCKNQSVVYIDGDCANSVANGWHYSFRLNGYVESVFFSDLQLVKTNLVAGSFLANGLLVSLGDVDLENLSPTSDGMEYLAQFIPSAAHSDAMKQSAEIEKGIASGNFHYSNKTNFKMNSTYALRSVAYKSDRKPKVERKNDALVSADDHRYAFLKDDKRVDVIIVFRVVRIEENGGITILWKELSRKNGPELIIPKNERLKDFR